METRNWKTIEGFDFKEILFEEYNGIAKITISSALPQRIHPTHHVGDVTSLCMVP